MTVETEEDLLDLCDVLVEHSNPLTVPSEAFLEAQFDAGLAWVDFPVGDGGLGLPSSWQTVVDDRLRAAGAPDAFPRNLIGIGMAAPTVAIHGTPAQRSRYLRPLFAGTEIWCQLFSEPGAGSDIANVATTATKDGDQWIVNGQKVWTTVAHFARFGMLLARTDTAAPKHSGLTYFILDMHAPGVEIRPLYQMTGDAEFNEVFMNHVQVPDSARLGKVGEGWRIAMTTLMNERVAIGGGITPRGSGFLGELLDVWRNTEQHLPATRDSVTALWIRAEVLRLTNLRASQLRIAGTPGPEGSIGKVVSAQLQQDIAELAVGLLGARGTLKPGGYPRRQPETPGFWDDPQQAFLRARANSIEGGTTEIAKNIIGERVLGLPGEPRVDKSGPWSARPR